MRPRENLSLLDVIENLNVLVEADSLDNIELTGSLFVSHKDEQEGLWTKAGYNEETLEVIKITFRSAYKYLHSFYRKIQSQGENKSLADGINTIIVLIGEAKKKLEKLNKIFAENVSQLPEYKDIETFYRSRIIKEVKAEDAENIPVFFMPATDDQWDREFEKLFGDVSEEEHSMRLLNDIESVKRDHLYELFYLKDVNGHPFYSAELARNIKLACDFGQYASDHFTDDPLIQINHIQDKRFQALASNILKSLKKELTFFYKEAFAHKDVELVMHLHNASMALMLAANPHNLIGGSRPKGCRAYFADFQSFLRESLHDREYQKFILYASSSLQEKPFFKGLINLIYGFCTLIFTQNEEHKDVTNLVKDLVGKNHENKPKDKTLSASSVSSYRHLQETLMRHPSGPVFKALDLIREEHVPPYDPMMLGYMPELDSLLQNRHKAIPVYRLPSPTKQEYAHVAEITEEFKTFLYALAEQHEHEHCLIFNFQDRTSWREHARVHVLEELSRNALFSDVLSVVTLAKDTDFYLQIGAYHHLSDAQEFMKQFLEHLQDESTGYYFPNQVREKLFPKFATELLEILHHEIFDGKKTLSLHARLDFIELAYLLIELKIIEIVKPTMISHLSKDGLDTAVSALSGLLVLLKGENLTDQRWNTLLLGPTLVDRERLLHADRFERLLSLIKLIETKDLKDVKTLYAEETWLLRAVVDTQ